MKPTQTQRQKDRLTTLSASDLAHVRGGACGAGCGCSCCSPPPSSGGGGGGGGGVDLGAMQQMMQQ